MIANVAALFAAGVEASWISSTFSKYWAFSDVHLFLQIGFSSPNPVLGVSCYRCSRAQESCWFPCQGPDCSGRCWISCSTSIFTQNHSLPPLLPPSPICKYCSMYTVLYTYCLRYFGFELLQVLPFVFKHGAVEREVGKPQDHLPACSTRSGTASFMLPRMELVSPALLQRLGTSVGPAKPLALYTIPPAAARHI